MKVERGAGAGRRLRGFRASPRRRTATGAAVDFLTSIAAARQEVQALFEISQDLGNSLSLDETLSVLAVRLRKHHSASLAGDLDAARATCWCRSMSPAKTSGCSPRCEIPVGQGLSGWVAENRKPILNGNPVGGAGLPERSRPNSPRCARRWRCRWKASNGVIGVLTLYHSERDAFTKDHLRILLAISSKIGMSDRKRPEVPAGGDRRPPPTI